MRRVADRLGVSHQAPYVHFGDRLTFLAAVAGAGLRAAAERAREAVRGAETDPQVRLLALADAYVDFVQSEPQLHDLAYGPMAAMRDHPRLQAAAIEYWDLLVEVVSACQPSNVPGQEVLDRSVAVWGLVYGIARLDTHQKIPKTVLNDPRSLVRAALDALHRGWHETT